MMSNLSRISGPNKSIKDKKAKKIKENDDNADDENWQLQESPAVVLLSP